MGTSGGSGLEEWGFKIMAAAVVLGIIAALTLIGAYSDAIEADLDWTPQMIQTVRSIGAAIAVVAVVLFFIGILMAIATTRAYAASPEGQQRHAEHQARMSARERFLADLRSGDLEVVASALKAIREQDITLSHMRLRGAILQGADLSGLRMAGVELTVGNLERANLQGADLRNAKLGAADLRHANLREAEMSGANLKSADLRGTDLQGANLLNADLRGADLTQAQVKDAALSYAKFNVKTILPDGSPWSAQTDIRRFT